MVAKPIPVGSPKYGVLNVLMNSVRNWSRTLSVTRKFRNSEASRFFCHGPSRRL
ncbi:hypothetical protein D3C83_292020 [compost metagenome]